MRLKMLCLKHGKESAFLSLIVGLFQSLLPVTNKLELLKIIFSALTLWEKPRFKQGTDVGHFASR